MGFLYLKEKIFSKEEKSQFLMFDIKSKIKAVNQFTE